jgi:hypothetical protein
MAKSQKHQVNPPTDSDREMLTDYSSVIQQSLGDLFLAAHDHLVLTANPPTSAGAIQTVSIVDTGTSVYLVVKTKRGWFKSPVFTAI